MSHYAMHVFVCTNQKAAGKACCANTGGEAFFEHLKLRLLELELYGPHKIRVSKSGCLGRCGLGPCLVVYPQGLWFAYNSMNDIDLLVEEYFLHGNVVPSLLIDAP